MKTHTFSFMSCMICGRLLSPVSICYFSLVVGLGEVGFRLKTVSVPALNRYGVHRFDKGGVVFV